MSACNHPLPQQNIFWFCAWNIPIICNIHALVKFIWGVFPYKHEKSTESQSTTEFHLDENRKSRGNKNVITSFQFVTLKSIWWHVSPVVKNRLCNIHMSTITLLHKCREGERHLHLSDDEVNTNRCHCVYACMMQIIYWYILQWMQGYKWMW